MRLRTRLFIAWGAVILLLWAGTLLPIDRAMTASVARMTANDFAGAKQGLHTLQAERQARMQQAGALIMSIPDLRALIAEHNYELSPENRDSLQERLDSLAQTLNLSFLCVLDARGNIVAQNSGSPWTTLPDLAAYAQHSPQASALIHRLFNPDAHNSGAPASTYGLWSFDSRLLEVVGLPLVFSTDERPEVSGALVMASPLTDQLAAQLGRGRHCEVSFFAGDAIVASSLPPNMRKPALAASLHRATRSADAFDMDLDGAPYRASVESLSDPCSGLPVGQLLIQSSLVDARATETALSRDLLFITAAGLAVAAFASYLVAGTVARPVRQLVSAARRVGGGDMTSSIATTRRDELGELASAFNDMVTQLRARRELERQVEESRALTRAKSQFLAHMSHEIRTPLNGVIGMAEILLRTDLRDHQRRYASLVKSSAQVLLTLLNDLLDLSKIDAGKLELECLDLDLPALVSDVVELLSPRATAKGLEIACQVRAGVPAQVRGDPTRIRQVLVNLVGNAVKFTESGQVVVRAELEHSAPDHALIRFSVSDTGIGIPQDRLDRLFKSFSQMDASTTRRYGGTGLGLAISKQLAELMGGQIGVSSDPGRGSTFWFTAKLPNSTLAPSPSAVPDQFRGLRALVADANDTSRKIICDQLLAWNMLPTGVSDGESALRELQSAATESPFAVALLSDRLAGQPSMQLASIAHQQSQAKPAVLLLIPLGEELKLTATADDIAGYVTKPIRASQMLNAIAAALGIPIDRPGATPSAANPLATGHGKLLLAEDNEVNQLVASSLLASAGFECKVVSDGQQAIDAWQNGQFDIVLMDVGMPHIDGLDATQAIRRIEQTRSAQSGKPHHVPIIALTASAGAEERQRCREAGMDAFCAKPFNPDELVATINSLLVDRSTNPPQPQAPEEQIPREPADHHPPATRESSVPFDVAGVLQRCSGKTTLVEQVLEKFQQQSAEAIHRIEHGLAETDMKQIAAASHWLKGSAGMICADSLHRAAAAMETIGKAGDTDHAIECLDRLKDEVARCVEFVSQARQGLTATTEVPHANPDR
jgi:signal transduction histidine kinase/CheY-like chemotaxis protein/HPt (histidine-containing phosphotransfer) domain-containing protein